jgi:hypothetical protein
MAPALLVVSMSSDFWALTATVCDRSVSWVCSSVDRCTPGVCAVYANVITQQAVYRE